MSSQDFTLTENAAKRILQLLEKEEDKNANLRISVLGGGCSGFQYNFDFDSDSNEDEDVIFSNSDANVIIDKTSLEFLKGSSLDYVQTLGSAAFTIKTPNATANCGCGNSFSV
jgi:iron-sulfur cluster insertion protein